MSHVLWPYFSDVMYYLFLIKFFLHDLIEANIVGFSLHAYHIIAYIVSIDHNPQQHLKNILNYKNVTMSSRNLVVRATTWVRNETRSCCCCLSLFLIFYVRSSSNHLRSTSKNQFKQECLFYVAKNKWFETNNIAKKIHLTLLDIFCFWPTL